MNGGARRTMVDDSALGCTSTSCSNAAMMILARCLSRRGSLSTQLATSLRHVNFRAEWRFQKGKCSPADARDDDDVKF
jgi:hypothetical protein